MSLRTNLAHHALVFAVVALCGCGEGGYDAKAACSFDSDCPGQQVCFRDGCGASTNELLVELTPTSTAYAATQDFEAQAANGRLDVQMPAPPMGFGTVSVQHGSKTIPYVDEVTVSGAGQSDVIPSESRSFTTRVSGLDGGFDFIASAGSYLLTAVAADHNLPPTYTTVEMEGESPSLVDLVFADPSTLVHLTGQVVANGSTFSSSDLSLQAFVADDGGLPIGNQIVGISSLALSQRVTADGGTFDLAVPSATLKNGLVNITVQSASQSLTAPVKTFTLDPSQTSGITLDLGSFGSLFEVHGQVVNPEGLPVASASVHLEGTVEGGGYFRSDNVLTDADGGFHLQTLPSAQAGNLTLGIVPQAGDQAASSLLPLAITQNSPDLTRITTAGRVVVTGNVALPGGSSPAFGVTVSATPIAGLGGDFPTPSSASLPGVSDASGNYALLLDPGVYRFDFQAVSSLPRTSIFVTVGSGSTLGVDTVVLSQGHELIGTVTSDGTPQARASIKLYRRVRLGDSDVAVPLVEDFTDDQGNYSVLIPSD